MMHIFTYITQNTINGKRYFGVHKTSNLYDGYVGSGVRLRLAIRKYGRENFTVIERVFYPTYELALEAEQAFVTKDIVESVEWYNMKLGGVGGEWSTEVKERMRVSAIHARSCRTAAQLEHHIALQRQNWDNKSDEEKAQHIKNMPKWNAKTDEERQAINNKRAGRWNAKTDEERQAISEKKRLAMLTKSDEEKAAISERKSLAMLTKSDEEKATRSARLRAAHARRTPEELEDINRKKRAARLGIPSPVVCCPHCGREGGLGAMVRWHFDNCKQKA